ncbi:MAG: DUF2281 domain-containing protein [Planctomycetaceae bacterium]|jgi:hypothetical protein|nr:DUF2281 domain-containing protein [Planctomycetaceae bacterium]
MPKKSVKKSVKKSAKKTVKKSVSNSGVGRPKGSGKFGCPTKAVRIPEHLEQEVLDFALRKVKATKAAK